jgi:beta-lactamase regulating signal transducer with metallopeptidase domain
MFWLRGVLVCISVFVLVYVCGSVAIGRAWRALARLAGSMSANTLYGLRMGPAVLAMLAVATLAVPSFLRYEPRVVEEGIGEIPLLLTVAFLLLAGSGYMRAWRALRHTERCLRRWTCGASSDIGTDAVLVDAPEAPPIALAGVGKATLLVSVEARALLTGPELERAIAHERSHRRAADNLKKLLLRACGFPGMAGLERAWLGAIELSADAKAVHSRDEALDLASALVKIARLHDGTALPELVSGFVDGPPATIELRVQRLLHWTRERSSQRPLRVLVPVLFALLLLACNYLPLLHSIHAATEFLVR